MPSTYEPISTQTLGSAQSSVSLTSISQAYTDLILVITPVVTSATTFAIRYNGVSTGTPYSATILSGDGSSATSTRVSSQNEIRISYGATSRSTNTGNIIVNILNYSNATTYKTNLSRENISTEGTGAIVGIWRSTAAITQIDLIPLSGGTIINTGTVVTLYGIKAA
jgi:hypothetical protein